MAVIQEIRRRSGKIIAPVIGAVVLVYFAYHTVQGDRGLLSYMRVSQEVARAEAALEQVRADRLALEHKADLLRGDSLDLDMLEEQTRFTFNYLHPNELLIYDKIAR